MTLASTGSARALAGASDDKALAANARRTIARGSKSFAAAAKLFDPQTRRSATMLYAWCRHCDDVIDGQNLGFSAGGAEPRSSPAARLEELVARTDAAMAGAPPDEPAFRALAEVAERHRLPKRLAMDHLEGYRMDVEGRRYRTIGETTEYCYHVAGVVGVMMSMVMGAREEETLDRACDLGIAFQLTNIARDLVEDALAGRIYLPEAWLEEAELPRRLVADRARAPQLAGLARRLVEAAEPYYASSRDGLRDLPPRSAWAVATAMGVYRRIGLKVVRKGDAAWDERVSTSRSEKLLHVAAGARLALASRGSASRPRPPTLWTRPRLPATH